MCGFKNENAAEDFEEHFAFRRSHGIEDGFTAEESGDNGGSPFRGYPETRRRRVDDFRADIIEGDRNGGVGFAAVSAEEGGVSFGSKREDRTVGFHGGGKVKNNTKIK